LKDGALLQAVSPDEKVKIALKPESIAIGKRDGGNSLTAHVTDRRYQGTQTVTTSTCSAEGSRRSRTQRLPQRRQSRSMDAKSKGFTVTRRPVAGYCRLRPE
jgi:hypothetical protein